MLSPGGAVRVTQVPSGVRYGAYLASVPAQRRIGDYAHAAARVLNAVFKRLAATATTWAPRASAEVHPAPITREQWLPVEACGGWGVRYFNVFPPTRLHPRSSRGFHLPISKRSGGLGSLSEG
jgi:hypothetical protein